MAGDPSAKRSHQAPTSQEFSERFFLWGNNSSTLQVNTLKYYEYGWLLISFSMLASTPIDQIDSEIVDAARVLQFPIIIFREEVSFSDLTRAAHEEILRPKSSHHYESTMETLLNSILETGRDKAFLDRELGPLLALPLRPRTTLTATLETLLDVHFNIAVAARKLGVRRQSIYYRLEQLTGLLGSLDDPSRKLGLLVAFALLRRCTPTYESLPQTTH